AMASIVDGLTSGMMPLFAHSSTTGGSRNLDLLKNAWKAANAQIIDNKLTQISIVNPTTTAFNAYKGQSETGNEIPNDNLMYRPTDISGGGMNIQDANLLKVRVTYCYTMTVPIINKLIYTLVVDPVSAPGNTGADMLEAQGEGGTTKNSRCSNINDGEYRIPVTSEAVVRMESTFQNPGKWVGP